MAQSSYRRWRTCCCGRSDAGQTASTGRPSNPLAPTASTLPTTFPGLHPAYFIACTSSMSSPESPTCSLSSGSSSWDLSSLSIAGCVQARLSQLRKERQPDRPPCCSSTDLHSYSSALSEDWFYETPEKTGTFLVAPWLPSRVPCGPANRYAYGAEADDHHAGLLAQPHFFPAHVTYKRSSAFHIHLCAPVHAELWNIQPAGTPVDDVTAFVRATSGDRSIGYVCRTSCCPVGWLADLTFSRVRISLVR